MTSLILAADCGMNPLCEVGGALSGAAGAVSGAVSSAAGAAAGGAVGEVADAVSDGVGSVLATLATAWVRVGTPDITGADGGPSDAVGFLQNSLWFYMALAAVASVLVAAGRMAWEQRSQPARDLLRSLLTLVLVLGASTTAIALATAAADGFSSWIIDRSASGGFGRNVTELLAFSTATGNPLGPMLVIVFGIIAIVVSALQIMLMIARAGMLVVLTGVIQISGSATNTEVGRQWFKRSVAWLVAFILYKPAAAIVYATAFKLMGTDLFGKGGLLQILMGLTLMTLALFALPAVAKVVTPLVGAVAGGAGAGGVIAAAAPMGAMLLAPVGGAPAAAMAGAGGGTGAAGAAGASGASGAAAPAGNASGGGEGPLSAGADRSANGDAPAPSASGSGSGSGSGPNGGGGPSGADLAARGAQEVARQARDGQEDGASDN